MARRLLTALTTGAALIASVGAQTPSVGISKVCPSDLTGICYSLHLPSKIFISGGGVIYFQIDGPATYSWIGLGQGSMMTGANIFIIYADGKGNVTLSPCLGHGNFEPEHHDDGADVELLAGSGISNGRMVANVKCSNCDKWMNGSMDLRADTTNWIGAALTGAELNSTDESEELMQHSVHAMFAIPMTAARGGESANPFYTPRIAFGPNNNQGGVDTHLAIAHGVLAALAFLVILPSGAIFVRFARFRGLVKVHAAIQLTGYAIYVAAAGMGIWMLIHYPPKYYRYEIYHDPHPKIGMALLAYLFFQPISGYINHMLFGKRGKRFFSHHIHIWGGRLAILLGFVNGGLGLRLGKVESAGARAGYGVVATISGVLFVLNIIFAQTRGKNAPNPSALIRGQVPKDEGAILGVGTGAGGQGSHVRMESMETDRERLHADGGQNRLD